MFVLLICYTHKIVYITSNNIDYREIEICGEDFK